MQNKTQINIDDQPATLHFEGNVLVVTFTGQYNKANSRLELLPQEALDLVVALKPRINALKKLALLDRIARLPHFGTRARQLAEAKSNA